MALIQLQDLGPRIIILGPSSSGKSTLAMRISEKAQIPVIHLDQLFHTPNTDWVLRPFDEFKALHQSALCQDRWVMEGNYTKLLPERLARATGLILLDINAALGLYRYLRRIYSCQPRYGALTGNQDSVKWNMIKHILVTTPKNRARYKAQFPGFNLPKIYLENPQALKKIYKEWDLG